MHGGPLEPSVHLFSFGAWCKGNERTRVRGLTCTKPAPAPEKKQRETWCNGNGGIRGSGLSCTKAAPASEEKQPGTWCKGNEGIRGSGFSCTKPAPTPEEKWPGTWCKVNEGTRVKGLSCTKSASRLGQRPVTSPKAPPSTGGLPQRRPPLTPQPVVKSTHMSTFVFFWIIIKLPNRI